MHANRTCFQRSTVCVYVPIVHACIKNGDAFCLLGVQAYPRSCITDCASLHLTLQLTNVREMQTCHNARSASAAVSRQEVVLN